MSRKVFTAGEVLAAADVNSFLMDQTVMSFAGTAARGSAIPSPVEGMYTHLEDTDRLEFYNGSSWQSPFGLTLLESRTFTAQTSVSFNNVFSSQYDNYTIKMSYVGSTNDGVVMRLRNAGTDFTSGAYWFNFVEVVNNAVSGSSALGATFWNLVAMRPTGIRNAGQVEVFNPAKSGISKNIVFQGSDWTGSAVVYRGGQGMSSTTTTYDGFSIIPSSGNFTGQISVYGVRK